MRIPRCALLLTLAGLGLRSAMAADAGIAVGEEALRQFLFGDRGQEAGQAVHACALMERLLRAPRGSTATNVD